MTPDIPIGEARLLWDSVDRTMKVVRRGTIESRLLDQRYLCSGGCDYTDWLRADTETQKAMLMVALWHIVGRDNTPFEVAHKAVMCIPEYREMLAEDFGA